MSTWYQNARVPVELLPPEFANACTGNRRLVDPAVDIDFAVEGDRIRQVTAAGQAQRADEDRIVDLDGALVFPGFVDAHTHLDKAHSLTRAPNPRHEFWDAIEVLAADKVNWSEDDLYKRADFALRSAWAHGTVALRTHLDSGPEYFANAYRVLDRLKEEWAGRIELQTVSLTGIDFYSTPEGEQMARDLVEAGSDFLGGMPMMWPDLDAYLDRLMAIAAECGVGLDLHVDENGDASTETLKRTAQAVLRNEFLHPVTCGHGCSLALHSPERQRATLELLREARIRVISLPLCNQYLQDRTRIDAPEDDERPFIPQTPRWRGITLLHECIEAGIPTAVASDNIRDAFYAYGDLDMLDVFITTIRLGHLDSRLAHAPAMVTKAPAEIMDLTDVGRVSPGMRADLVVFPARSFSELLSRPWQPRRLIRGEAFREAVLPDYRELR